MPCFVKEILKLSGEARKRERTCLAEQGRPLSPARARSTLFVTVGRGRRAPPLHSARPIRNDLLESVACRKWLQKCREAADSVHFRSGSEVAGRERTPSLHFAAGREAPIATKDRIWTRFA